MYNTRDEVDVLTEALRHITAGHYCRRYEQDLCSGEFSPAGWKPSLAEYFEL